MYQLHYHDLQWVQSNLRKYTNSLFWSGKFQGNNEQSSNSPMLQAYCTTSLNRIQNREFECQMQTGRSFTPNTQWDATLMCFYESKKSVGIPSSAVPEFDISNAEYRIVEGWIYKNKHARETRFMTIQQQGWQIASNWPYTLILCYWSKQLVPDHVIARSVRIMYTVLVDNVGKLMKLKRHSS